MRKNLSISSKNSAEKSYPPDLRTSMLNEKLVNENSPEEILNPSEPASETLLEESLNEELFRKNQNNVITNDFDQFDSEFRPFSLAKRDTFQDADDKLINWKLDIDKTDDAYLKSRSKLVRIKTIIRRWFMNSIIEKLRVKNLYVRRFLAEFWGSFVFYFFTASGAAQNTLYPEATGNLFLTQGLSSATGLFVAIMSCANLSGAVFNPAVSFYFFIYEGLRWWELCYYIFAQVLGCYISAGFVYLQYMTALSLKDPDKTYQTLSIFCTFPQATMTVSAVFYCTLINTVTLVTSIYTNFDRRQMLFPYSSHAAIPIIFGIGIFNSFGYQSGIVNNPAIDFGGRLFCATIGYSSDLWYFPASKITGYQKREVYYFWLPLIGPFIGSILAGILYNLFLGLHFPKADVNANYRLRSIEVLGNQRPHLVRRRIKKAARYREFLVDRKRSQMLRERELEIQEKELFTKQNSDPNDRNFNINSRIGQAGYDGNSRDRLRALNTGSGSKKTWGNAMHRAKTHRSKSITLTRAYKLSNFQKGVYNNNVRLPKHILMNNNETVPDNILVLGLGIKIKLMFLKSFLCKILYPKPCLSSICQ